MQIVSGSTPIARPGRSRCRRRAWERTVTTRVGDGQAAVTCPEVVDIALSRSDSCDATHLLLGKAQRFATDVSDLTARHNQGSWEGDK